MNKRKKWVILDRDGTLIAEKHYLYDPEKVEIIPGVIDGLFKLIEYGYKLIVVTNQSGIGRGYYNKRDMDAVNSKISALLGKHKIEISGYYYCPHIPDAGCNCRKPEIGLVLKASKELHIDLSEIVCVIGDKRSDIGLAENIGVPSILVLTGHGPTEYSEGLESSYIVQDLNEASKIALKLNGG